MLKEKKTKQKKQREFIDHISYFRKLLSKEQDILKKTIEISDGNYGSGKCSDLAQSIK